VLFRSRPDPWKRRSTRNRSTIKPCPSPFRALSEPFPSPSRSLPHRARVAARSRTPHLDKSTLYNYLLSAAGQQASLVCARGRRPDARQPLHGRGAERADDVPRPRQRVAREGATAFPRRPSSPSLSPRTLTLPAICSRSHPSSPTDPRFPSRPHPNSLPARDSSLRTRRWRC
jgi:hypothetical protein